MLEWRATRLEARLFGGLAAAGVGAILLALVACAQYVAAQATVLAALENPARWTPPVPAAACCATTNAAPPEARPLAAAGRTKA
jgi:hypothetical protein